MRYIPVVLLLVLASCSCALGSQPEPGQSSDFKALLSGKVFPLTVRLKDLDSGWRRFTGGGEETAGYSQVWHRLFASTGGAFYTKGDTVTVAGETYLVAYSLQIKPTSQYALMRMPAAEWPEPEKLTPDTPLDLALLNVRTLGSLTGIRPFDLAAEIAEYQKTHAELRQMEERRMDARVRVGVGPVPTGLDRLQELATAFVIYVADYDVLPSMQDAELLREELSEYVSDEVFDDPETGQPYAVNSGLAGKAPSEIADPARMVVFYQQEPGADGRRGVAFFDGHAEKVGEAEWEKLKAESGIR